MHRPLREMTASEVMGAPERHNAEVDRLAADAEPFRNADEKLAKAFEAAENTHDELARCNHAIAVDEAAIAAQQKSVLLAGAVYATVPDHAPDIPLGEALGRHWPGRAVNPS